MTSELIIIQEYCIQNQVEPDFIIQLENEGLIQVSVVEEERYIHISQLKNLDQYVRWYYDLSINVEGIDVIQNLLDKIDEMQNEIHRLKEQIRLID
ncbi:chaperone modulator CbpM [Dysgonomonas sp. Marseille-P4677]|uniref:chaperone modulator CbpM n=1 Tax=Dysgonomonas sp. Marseille-P4677 TaxID=2364790 RepID=UPI0019126DAE|nr:chaperone modulator CbpM [Dysgonomonas sp. Marseille-P4677]MBK5719576.1 chaperone modulator CbpM [Dysgonomonas sp. Marseille-P4677]